MSDKFDGRTEVRRRSKPASVRSAAALLLIVGSVVAAPRPVHRYTRYHVMATAFCQRGITKAGTVSHTGTVAADPRFLPLGTEIRLHNAGVFDTTYIVTDTGPAIRGRRIDIYMPSVAVARKFGRREVWIQVVKWGDGAVSPRVDHAVHRHAVKKIRQHLAAVR